MIDSNAIADLQMLMNAGDGRQAVLTQLLQSDKFSRHSPRRSLATIGLDPEEDLTERYRLIDSNDDRGAYAQQFHRQQLQPVSPARIRYARLPANIITTLDHLPQKDKTPLIDFTEGLVHRFNNIFMAVVGHLSIVMLQLDADKTAYRRLRDCEELIHNTALLLRLLVDVFNRPRHAPHTLYPIDLSDHEISKLIFASDTHKPNGYRATSSKLSVHKIQMIMAAMMGRRLHRIFQTLQHQTTRIFHAKELKLRIGEHHQAIGRHLKRGSAIANDLMYFANAIEIDRHPTALSTIIKDAVTIFQSDNPELKITVENSSTPVCLNAESNLLRRMIWEILANAKEAIPHGGEVRIKLGAEKAAKCDSSIAPPQLAQSHPVIRRQWSGGIGTPWYSCLRTVHHPAEKP